MDSRTVTRIRQLNSRFYTQAAAAFAISRQLPWPGWELMSAWLQDKAKPASVLDLGCGNGRLYQFLQKHFPGISYTGVDNSAELLALAKANYPQATFIEQDILELQLFGQFDLICSFGVMHHLPGQQLRRKFLTQVRDIVSEGGFAVFTFWDISRQTTLLQRQQPWEKAGISASEVEPNDYLLDWDKNPGLLRYAHEYTDSEITKLFAGLFTIEHEFLSDGRDGKSNRYIIARRT